MNGYRLVWKGIWLSAELANLPMPARVLFIGMITEADDQGRLENNPALLRASTFAYDDVGIDQVAAWVRALADSSMILAYVSPSGQELLQIVNWWKYQRLQFARPSNFPPPDGWSDRIRYRSSKRILTCNWVRQNGVRVPDTCDANGFDLDQKGLFAGGGQVSGQVAGLADPLSKEDPSFSERDARGPARTRTHASAHTRGPEPVTDPPQVNQVSGRVSGQVSDPRIILDDVPVAPVPSKKKVSRRPSRLKLSAQKVAGFGDPGKFVRGGRIPQGKGSNAVEVYYEQFSVVEYSERLNDIQMEALLTKVVDLDKFREVLTAWAMAGNKPSNVQGLIDWYFSGARDNQASARIRSGRNAQFLTAAERGIDRDEYSSEMEQVFQ